MVVEDEPIPDKNKSWSRVAIAFDLKKIDGTEYSLQSLLPDSIFSEFDIYRRNFRGCASKELGVIEYHVDQIPVGQWRHYNIDINDFIQHGFGIVGCDSWGKEWHDQSFVNQWYLVIENLASRTKARVKNLELYEF